MMGANSTNPSITILPGSGTTPGKVGIFTTNPSNELTVSGAVKTITSATPYNYGFICEAGDDRTKAIDVNRNGYSQFLVTGAGDVYARSLQITVGQFQIPDYVFEKGYKLLAWDSLENSIKENGHLPNFPSAKKITESKYYNVAEIQLKTIEKLEELYLYVLELKKENEELKKLIQNKD
jgi:hypothetical protein